MIAQFVKSDRLNPRANCLRGRGTIAGLLLVLVIIAVGCDGAEGGSQAAVVAPAQVVGTAAPGDTPPGMVWIPGGEFWMGGPASDRVAVDSARHNSGGPVCAELAAGFPDARPAHRVKVDGFWMDATEVTNEEFARFVRATGYVTVAERKPTPEQYPGAPPEMLVAGSVVFTPPRGAVGLDNPLQWWSYVPGADWRHPSGLGSTIEGREKYPVVHVAYEDAAAYAAWAGKQLPTEAEWECAARDGLDRQPYAWGVDFRPDGRYMANTWQGRFPDHDTAADGYAGVAPVTQFPPNGYGLYDVAGNVWEWCADWYRPDYYASLAAAGGVAHNPRGPADSFDPDEPGVPKRVQRGGSFLCSDQYCARHRVGARGKAAADTGTSHAGFRCVKGASTNGHE